VCDLNQGAHTSFTSGVIAAIISIVVLKFIPAQPDFIALLQKAGSRKARGGSSSSRYDLIAAV